MTSPTKADLANLLFEKVGLNKREAKDMVGTAFSRRCVPALEAWRQASKLSGFGNFQFATSPSGPVGIPRPAKKIRSRRGAW